MKLLKKKEINKEKSLERMAEIDQGAKLAKKVDSLRELHAKEQENLIKFRNESVKKVTKEINSYLEERDDLKDEISSLEEKKKILLIPLDEEWNKVNARQNELNNFAQGLNEKHLFFEQQKNEIEVERQKIADDKQRTTEGREQSIKELAESVEKKEKADRILAKADETERNVSKILSEREQQLITRESNIASMERDIKNKNENLERGYQFISEETIRLADQRKTLERAMARIKN